ncbi:DUF4352 domain-containing protein [Corynebacterium suedekumii]|nr:DUF4352 domain-containing protein [Corynebacterium suedekumii]
MNTTQHSGQNPYGAGQPFQAGQPGQPGQYQAVPVEQPKKKKKWPWIVGILAVLVVGGMITGGDSDETTTAESTTSEAAPVDTVAPVAEQEEAPVEEAPAEETDPATDVPVGETARSGDVAVTVSNLRFASDVLGQYICSDVAYLNEGDSSKHFSQFDFKLHKPNGVIADTTFTGLDIKNLESAELAPGGATDGTVCFDTDGTPGEYQVEYSGGFFSSPLTWTTTL